MWMAFRFCDFRVCAISTVCVHWNWKEIKREYRPYWHATDRRSNQIYSTSCFAFIYFYLFIIIPCVATKLLFIPPYEILIDFFRAVIYLKKIEEGAGIFHVTSSQSCQNTLLSSLFTSLSLLKAQSYLALADAARHVVGRRKRRRWQSNNIICYMWRKKGRNGIAKLPRFGGGRYNLSLESWIISVFLLFNALQYYDMTV